MDSVIPALEHALSQTHEPRLRQQLTDTIERLRERQRREDDGIAARADGRRRSPQRKRRSAKSSRMTKAAG
jgi:hypothetical protein